MRASSSSSEIASASSSCSVRSEKFFIELMSSAGDGKGTARSLAYRLRVQVDAAYARILRLYGLPQPHDRAPDIGHHRRMETHIHRQQHLIWPQIDREQLVDV